MPASRWLGVGEYIVITDKQSGSSVQIRVLTKQGDKITLSTTEGLSVDLFPKQRTDIPVMRENVNVVYSRVGIDGKARLQFHVYKSAHDRFNISREFS